MKEDIAMIKGICLNAAVQLRELLSDPDNKANLYRIEQLKADIKSGNYQIDFENVSKKMLELNEGLQIEGT